PASAQVACQALPRLIPRGPGIPVQQRDRRHHLARRAEAALRTKLVEECLLHRMQAAIGGTQPLDGDDLAHLDAVRESGAGVVADIIDEDCTGPAFTTVAAELGAGEIQL